MSERPFKQPSVMTAQQHFSRVPSADIERSRFNRSHGHKTTMDAGWCVPFFIDEVLPGDTHHMSTTVFARLATPLKPFMDNIHFDVHYFFVPMRLVWDHWQEFMGERKDPDDDPNDFTIPMIEYQVPQDVSYTPHTIAKYLGLPMARSSSGGGSGNVEVSALPGRCVKLIWNEWYRDENLQDPLPVPRGAVDPVDDDIYYSSPVVISRGKRRDYFTSCLPWPQKGDPVLIPIGDEAIVTGWRPDDTNNWTPFGVYGMGGASTTLPVQITGSGTTGGSGIEFNSGGLVWDDASNQGLHLDPAKQVGIADLSTASAISINDLRTAFQVQRLLERDARGGTRYIELLLSHFGVTSSDSRLQRPEYLGGGESMVNVNPLASTVPVFATEADPAVPQANLAGVGTTVNRSGFTKSFEEHGYIIGFMSAWADLTYQRMIERFWSRKTRYDFYWPALAHLGEQPVLNKELWFTSNPTIDEAVFGYQERYAEYRYKPSQISGLFNSDANASLDVWHLAQDFSSVPALNAAFIREDPPIDRVIAVPSEPHFLVDVWHQYESERPLPVYSVPGMIDHF